MKKIISVLICAALLLSSGGCADKNEAQMPEAKTVTDHAGNTITLPEKVETIAICGIYPLASVISVFFDSADKIVGMPEMSMTAAKNSILSELYPEILNAETGYEKNGTVNVEELLELSPDVVFYSESDKQTAEALKGAGFCAVGVSVNKWGYNAIETLNQWIELLSQIFPENDKAELVKKSSGEIYDMIQSRVKDIPDDERERIFFLFNYTDTAVVSSGKNFFGQWWADAVGAVNVAEELEKDNAVPVNMEQVYRWNPSVIFITNFTSAYPDDLYNNTFGTYDWSGVDAVENKQVYKMPLGMYRSYTPGADTPITLLWMAKSVYPELFKDVDVIEELIKYYGDVFGVTLTQNQAKAIFEPKVTAENYISQ